MGTPVDGAHAVGQFGGGEQAVGLEHLALAMQPFGLDRIEPRALDRQVTDEQADTVTRALDLPVVRPDPGTDDLGVVPGGVVPDQQDGALALSRSLGGAPVQEVDRHGAHGAAVDETQPERLAASPVGIPGAGQEAITGQGFGVGVIARDRLLDQSEAVVVVLPGVQGRTGQSAPPDLVLEAEQPVRMGLGQPDQTVAPSLDYS